MPTLFQYTIGAGATKRSNQVLRAAPAAPKYVRWQSTQHGWEMQTAVTTFVAGNSTNMASLEAGPNVAAPNSRLELHSQLHFGDFDYFDFYNSALFNDRRTVLYELLLDEKLLANETRGMKKNFPQRFVTGPLSASPADKLTAMQYGWSCQVDVIGYDRPNWIHADLTRQELLSLAQQPHQMTMRPLWRTVGEPMSVVPAPAAEAATALLVGPPILDAEYVQRRLFSNLFIPGDALAQFLRSILWFTVPSPELSVLLLDWSSLLSNRVTGLSQITVPVLQAVIAARFDQVKKLMFGQVVITSNQIVKGGKRYNLLIQQRNQRALDVLETIQKSHLQDSDNSGTCTLALLYGCSHCPDLHKRLIQDYGYRPIKTEWRTAWKIQPQRQKQETGKDADDSTTIGLVVLFLMYFAVGGFDWIATVGDMAREDSAIDMIVAAALYLARHLLLYVGLSKLLLDWETADEAMQ
ncbi:hypothetical protein ACA910_016950 [Epithemia clementina (nom. ined.)]